MPILHSDDPRVYFESSHDNPAFDPWTARAQSAGGPGRFPTEAEFHVRENGVYPDDAPPGRFPDVYDDECPETDLHDDFEPSELDRAEAAALLAIDAMVADDEMFFDGRLFPEGEDDLNHMLGQRVGCRFMPKSLADLDQEIAELRARLNKAK